MTSYTAAIVREGHATDYLPLDATNDDAARAQTVAIAAEHPDAQVYCECFRASDQQRGYINRGGADVTGEPY